MPVPSERSRTRAAALRPRVRPQVRARPRLASLAPSGKSLVAALALAVLGVGSYAVARETSLFAVRHVRVEGATPALAQQVTRALAPIRGESLVALDRDRALARVEALPDVLAAELDRSFPHTLVVRVQPERPAAVLRRGGASWLVSARGRVLRQVVRATHARLPRIWVTQAVGASAGVILTDSRALRTVRALAPLRAEPLPVAVRTVGWRDGELVFRLRSGIELRLGDDSDVELKLAVAASILRDLDAPAAGGPRYLDVAVPERPVAGSNPQVEG